MTRVKEVCVETYAEVLAAIAGGATRIELCNDLSCGGTTPYYGTIRKVIKKVKVPVMVMVRPRGGDFCYTNDEFESMVQDIAVCKVLGATGVVFGLLNPDLTIDMERTSELVTLARPMEVTFHKAIDLTTDILMAVHQIKQMGIDRILTSGGAATAMEGAETLQKMAEIAGDTPKLIVAGKVTWENFDEIQQLIPSDEYHGRRLVKYSLT